MARSVSGASRSLFDRLAPRLRMLSPSEDLFNVPILTPSLKSRKTAKVILPNGMKAYIISDPQTSMSGAALAVETGSWRDEKQYEGTAHFLEHMLFLGTEKYPKEYEYERYITDNNGNMNAYTSSDHSLYYFEVTPKALEGALDRFSEFFKRPLFNESCVEREMNAVDQEYRKNIESDGWRVLHVRKDLSDPQHPFSYFNTGNLETMKKIDPAVLKEWYAKYYSAEIMNLVVVGKEKLDVLVEWVSRYFDAVPSKASKELEVPVSIFRDDVKGNWVYIEPLKDLRELALTWEIPPELTDMDSKPASLLGHVLGHEGEHSLLALLKKLHLAEELSAGKSELGGRNNFFEISLSLTEHGLANRELVVELIFQAMQSIRDNGEYPKYLYDELNLVAETQYKFQQQSRGSATRYATLLRKEDLSTFPMKSLFVSKFSPGRIRDLLDTLVPETCVITVVALDKSSEGGFKSPKLDRKEQWMEARYALVPFSSEELHRWKPSQGNPEVRYPVPNPFIPDNLQLVNQPPSEVVASLEGEQRAAANSRPPVLLKDDPRGQLWCHTDDEFWVPELSYSFTIKTPSIRPDNAKSLVLADLYLRFVHERLNQISYPAHYAGLSYGVSVFRSVGIDVSISGYSQKADKLLAEVLDRVVAPGLTLREFEIFKESLSRDYKNAAKDPPVRQAFERVSQIMYKQYVPMAGLAHAIDNITFEDLTHFVGTLYNRHYIEGFVGGNVLPKSAHSAYDLLVAKLGGTSCLKEEVKLTEVVPLSVARPQLHRLQLDVKGNAIAWIADCGPKTVELVTGVELLGKLMKEPFYSELRTVQQTGYLVHSGTMVAGNQRMFVQTSVQSNSHNARDLLSRIELFLETFLRDLPKSEERFESLKASVLDRLLHPYDNLAAKNRHLARLSFEENANFDYVSERIRCLESYTLADLVSLAQAILGRDNRARAAVLTSGNDPENTAFSYEEVGAKL
ncbi:putative ptr insulinase family/protease III [Gonapodya prolifera JEL478]|uniref:Putative ptr insulinase family/protease III n=1 Tax=Gonapodya prolifera (strain JEL478) TaxID=1344416 RepID=A0A139ATD2_GONPJ|nr:putative ptr insulinase family/protease III [Gonapodya prolifera JEL478]|eukprot:KXS19755.1 putative ptr insulinase family/protease III [Gonapodya prolifera JEL478]